MTRISVLIVVLVLVLPGCVKLKDAPLDRKNYVLEVTRSGEAVPNSGRAIRLLRLGIVPTYGGKGLVYRLPDGRIASDYYNEYFSSPEILLTQELRQWLQASELVTIVPAHSVALCDAVLEGNVTELYGDFTGKTPKAVLEMQFFLVSEMNESEIVFHKTYHQEIAMSTESPEALVTAMNDAAAGIFASLEKDLAERL